LNNFKSYYEEEVAAIDDPTLLKELRVITDILSATARKNTAVNF